MKTLTHLPDSDVVSGVKRNMTHLLVKDAVSGI